MTSSPRKTNSNATFNTADKGKAIMLEFDLREIAADAYVQAALDAGYGYDFASQLKRYVIETLRNSRHFIHAEADFLLAYNRLKDNKALYQRHAAELEYARNEFAKAFDSAALGAFASLAEQGLDAADAVGKDVGKHFRKAKKKIQKSIRPLSKRVFLEMAVDLLKWLARIIWEWLTGGNGNPGPA